MKTTPGFNTVLGILVTCFSAILIVMGVRQALAPCWQKKGSISVYALVEHVGDLRVASPVKLGGVTIGRVSQISIRSEDLDVQIELILSKEIAERLPLNTEIKILAVLPFGETYIDCCPNRDSLRNPKIPRLKHGDQIVYARSAIRLEELVSNAYPFLLANLKKYVS